MVKIVEIKREREGDQELSAAEELDNGRST